VLPPRLPRRLPLRLQARIWSLLWWPILGLWRRLVLAPCWARCMGLDLPLKTGKGVGRNQPLFNFAIRNPTIFVQIHGSQSSSLGLGGIPFAALAASKPHSQASISFLHKIPMSALVHSRTSCYGPKSTVVRCCINGRPARVRSECPLNANRRQMRVRRNCPLCAVSNGDGIFEGFGRGPHSGHSLAGRATVHGVKTGHQSNFTS
jgi:hypothetical protein